MKVYLVVVIRGENDEWVENIVKVETTKKWAVSMAKKLKRSNIVCVIREAEIHLLDKPAILP